MQKVNDIAVFAAAALFWSAPVLEAQQFRAFWVDAYHYGFRNPAEIEQLIADVAMARANVIVAEVRRDGESFYLDSPEPPANDAAYSQNFDALGYLVDRAHAAGLQVHAWFPVTPLWRSGAQPQSERHLWYAHGPRAEGSDMWMTVSSAGNISGALDPGHPGVLKYVTDLLVDCASKYDIDGVHLDYIRYPEDADYGWNPVAVERFNRLYGREGLPAAKDPAWSEFRRAQISAITRQVYLRSLAFKPKLTISAAVITWGNGPVDDAGYRALDAYNRVFQDWRGWLEEGIIDLAIPMNYFREPQYAGYLNRWMAFEKDRQYRRAVAIGLAPYLNSIPDSIAQLKGALEPSPNGRAPWGVTLYSYASTNLLDARGLPSSPNADFYRSVADYFGEVSRVPALPWKIRPDRGHALGWVQADGGDASSIDGVTVSIVSADDPDAVRTTVTDGTGFFGVVDLPPGTYFARLERDGGEWMRSAAQELRAGAVARFDFLIPTPDSH